MWSAELFVGIATELTFSLCWILLSPPSSHSVETMGATLESSLHLRISLGEPKWQL